LTVTTSVRLTADLERKLRSFEQLLRERAIPAGWISRADEDRLWTRHILDSLRTSGCLVPADHQVADLGSGAGLPGIPLALAEPDRRFSLIERSSPKAGFLELVVEELNLQNVSVEPRAIQDVDSAVDVCVARALAGPLQSWRLARGLLGSQGRLLYFAGRSWDDSVFASQMGGEVSAQVCVTGRFPWQGPIVMMMSL
jgi:16S rRNA (guanine527-N7)-methyltransferase